MGALLHQHPLGRVVSAQVEVERERGVALSSRAALALIMTMRRLRDGDNPA